MLTFNKEDRGFVGLFIGYWVFIAIIFGLGTLLENTDFEAGMSITLKQIAVMCGGSTIVILLFFLIGFMVLTFINLAKKVFLKTR